MDPKDLEFEETLADSELLQKNTARSMDEDAEFTLESILAEYGSGTPAAHDLPGRVQYEHPIVFGDGLIKGAIALQNEGVGREPTIVAKTVIDGDPCVGNAGRSRI